MKNQGTTQTTTATRNGYSVLFMMLAVSTGLIVLQLLLINNCGGNACDAIVAGAAGPINFPIF